MLPAARLATGRYNCGGVKSAGMAGDLRAAMVIASESDE